MQIYLLSGQIQSGKSTYLLNYIKEQINCSGIVSPVMNGHRYFYSICSKEMVKMEADSTETNVLEIGKYKFSKAAFDWAIKQLNESLQHSSELLIIDEIGPLELKDQGFSGVLKQLLTQASNINNLLLVVRESAVEEVIAHFQINSAQLNFWDWQPYRNA